MRMRRGLSLIELIFSIIIVIIVFGVIPKILQVSNRSIQTQIKQEALFDAISLVNLIIKLPWDRNTSENDGSILNADGVLCDKDTGYRPGGFVGSRSCIEGIKNNDGEVPTPNDEVQADCADIDDYNDASCYGGDTTSGGLMPYNIKATINRDKDRKHIVVEVNATNEDESRIGKFKAQFFYDSYNLGWIQINKRAW